MGCRSFAAGCVLISMTLVGGCGGSRASSLEVREKAEAGDAASQHELALRYERGDGVPRDIKQALQWHEKAAARNYLPATVDLGFLYMQGEGVKHNYARALELNRKAATAGSPAGMHNLAVMYDAGWGVAENDAEAVRWYRKAADLGRGSSQYNLGVSYRDGEGVAPDRLEAMKWFHIARMNPSDKQAQWAARAALEEMGWSFTGRNETKLSKADDDEVTRRVKQWQEQRRRRG